VDDGGADPDLVLGPELGVGRQGAVDQDPGGNPDVEHLDVVLPRDQNRLATVDAIVRHRHVAQVVGTDNHGIAVEAEGLFLRLRPAERQNHPHAGSVTTESPSSGVL